MRLTIFMLLLTLVWPCSAQQANPQVLLRTLQQRFGRVNDYKAQINMQFDIPGVRMKSMSGRVFYRKPNKFRIRTGGIFFLPRQNPIQHMSTMLLDTAAYTPVISGYETINNRSCAILNLIPLKNDQEIVMGRFWVDMQNPQILKSQITTRNNGTIETENQYGSMQQYNLPDRIVIHLDMQKIKMSRLMAADLNKKSKPKGQDKVTEKGKITLQFSNYILNSSFPEMEFTAPE